LVTHSSAPPYKEINSAHCTLYRDPNLMHFDLLTFTVISNRTSSLDFIHQETRRTTKTSFFCGPSYTNQEIKSSNKNRQKRTIVKQN